jgi:hypothetical protein
MLKSYKLIGKSGVYTIEVAMLFAAVAIAATVMASYVSRSMRAKVSMTQTSLNTAMHENCPQGC